MTLPDITSPRPVSLVAKSVETWLPVAIVLAVLAFALGSSGYIVTVIGFAAIYGIFCTGLNLFMGYTGQASFGQNAFAAFGGYGSAILTATYMWDPVPALFVSMTFSGVVAAVIGYPILKLQGHYLAMATFTLGLIVYEISVEWAGLTQGYMGYSGIPPMGIGSFVLGTEKQQLILLALMLLLGVWVSIRLRHSRFGNALVAIAGSEQAARALGINVSRYKLAAFVISALYASVAGSLFAHFVGFISPEIFGLAMIIQSFTMLFLGGIGTIWGPAVGALVVVVLPEFLRRLSEVQDIAYSIILILILIFAPKGVFALVARRAARRQKPAE
ncbi:MAG: branched-chain amino acid ABC transporter permease [Rhizobiaceae bacterium]|nr:branched-chain amino acid ABC transporter permease [Rhizobiaceae bacterium]